MAQTPRRTGRTRKSKITSNRSKQTKLTIKSSKNTVSPSSKDSDTSCSKESILSIASSTKSTSIDSIKSTSSKESIFSKESIKSISSKDSIISLDSKSSIISLDSKISTISLDSKSSKITINSTLLAINSKDELENSENLNSSSINTNNLSKDSTIKPNKNSPTKATTKTKKSQKQNSKKKSTAMKKEELNSSKNHLITEYYKVTKRKTAKTLKEEQDKEIAYYIENDIDDIKSLKIEEFKDKGKGIVTTRKYTKGSFICEYRGNLIDTQKAKELEKLYESQQLGCYMYYFHWSNKQLCIDATADTGRYGRLINHSRKKPNLKSKLFIFKNIPRLIFVALDDIEENTELLYDYGETNRCAIEAHPWIKNT